MTQALQMSHEFKRCRVSINVCASTDCCRNDRLAHLSCRLWPPAVSAGDDVAGISCERTPVIYEHVVSRVLSFFSESVHTCHHCRLVLSWSVVVKYVVAFRWLSEIRHCPRQFSVKYVIVLVLLSEVRRCPCYYFVKYAIVLVVTQ